MIEKKLRKIISLYREKVNIKEDKKTVERRNRF